MVICKKVVSKGWCKESKTNKMSYLKTVFGVRDSVTFHLVCVYIILSSVRLLSGHLLRNSCSLG